MEIKKTSRKVKPLSKDKERYARMVSKKAENLRAKNKKIATGTKKSKSSAYQQTKPAAKQTAIDRKFSPFGKFSPRAGLRSAASKTIDMFRGKEGKAEAERARKDAKDEVKANKYGGGKVYKKAGGGKVYKYAGGGKVKYRRIGGKVINGNDITKMIYG
jgi:hypothetical protein